MEVVELGGIPSINNAAKLLYHYADQIDFAISVALNDTAQQVRDFEVSNVLPETFTLRSNWFQQRTRFGINVQPSNKTNLEAHVFTKAPWLRLQEYAGEKGGTYRFITMPAKDLRQSTDRLIPQDIQPAKVLANMKMYHAFFIKENIFQRIGPDKGDIRLLFVTKPQTHIPQRLHFRSEGAEQAMRVYKQAFGKALAYAIATKN